MDPFWCMNHGPTTSLYYHDHGGNTIETRFDNLGNEAADAYMTGEAYRINPIGDDLESEEFIQRMEAGKSLESLMEYKSGPRGLEAVQEW